MYVPQAEMMGRIGAPFLCIFGRPYIIPALDPQGVILASTLSVSSLVPFVLFSFLD